MLEAICEREQTKPVSGAELNLLEALCGNRSVSLMMPILLQGKRCFENKLYPYMV